MYLFRFCGGELVVTTEETLARELEKGKKVGFVDEEGKGLVASLKFWVVGDVAERVDKMHDLLKEWE